MPELAYVSQIVDEGQIISAHPLPRLASTASRGTLASAVPWSVASEVARPMIV